MFIYIICNIHIGRQAYNLDKYQPFKDIGDKFIKELKEIPNIKVSEIKIVNLDSCWFSAEVMMSLGMWGTILGLLLCLNSFGLVDTTNQQSISELLRSMAKSMGIAAWTTLVGLLCAILTKVQCYYLENQSK